MKLIETNKEQRQWISERIPKISFWSCLLVIALISVRLSERTCMDEIPSDTADWRADLMAIASAFRGDETKSLIFASFW
ncbi:hypothetical protein YC2023_040718 [Brassica napus]